MNLQFICTHIGHWRSKRAARFIGYNWRSKCIFCGTKLVRVAPHVWKPAHKARWLNLDQDDLFRMP
jgi:hypothetical protein